MGRRYEDWFRNPDAELGRDRSNDPDVAGFLHWRLRNEGSPGCGQCLHTSAVAALSLGTVVYAGARLLGMDTALRGRFHAASVGLGSVVQRTCKLKETAGSVMERRQQIGLFVGSISAIIVVTLAVATRNLGVLGFLGLSALLMLAFRKR